MYTKIKNFLKDDWSDYRSVLASSLDATMPLTGKVNEYLQENGGKQLRPVFTLLVAKALRGRCNNDVIKCAAASEMLHTATLLHDDVVDNSPLRRGVPTVMSLFSPTTSVLIGDFWLSKVIDIVVDHHDRRVLKIFSKCLEDLAEGEMLQLEKSSSLDMTESDYLEIIYRKTASLFEASMLSSAYSVDATDEEIEAVRGYSHHIGLSFQMMDDIFDYSPMLDTGKPAGLDILEKKITLPLLGAFANAPATLVDELKERISRIGENPSDEDMSTVADAESVVKRYGGLEYATKRLHEEIFRAISSINTLHDSMARKFLVGLASYMAERVR